MTAALVEQAAAKINLTLRVRGRRDDGYHELESLVAFADLADTLTLQPSVAATLDIAGPFAAASGKTADNLVLKAERALRQRIAGLTVGRFLLEKNIPVAAGIGGGSADAAAALRLLARANGIAPGDARLAAAALAVGADVPVCLDSVPRIMRGRGETLSAPLRIEKLPAVLVNPGVEVSTRAVFAAFSLDDVGKDPLDEVPQTRGALVDWLGHHGNDLTRAALALAPMIGEVLSALQGLTGCRLARMSGSGPTCFGLFSSEHEASAAAASLRAQHKAWWIYAGLVG